MIWFLRTFHSNSEWIKILNLKTVSLLIFVKIHSSKNNQFYDLIINLYTCIVLTSTRRHGVFTLFKLQMTNFFIKLPVITSEINWLLISKTTYSTKTWLADSLYVLSTSVWTGFFLICISGYLPVVYECNLNVCYNWWFFFNLNCDLEWNRYYLHCKGLLWGKNVQYGGLGNVW